MLKKILPPKVICCRRTLAVLVAGMLLALGLWECLIGWEQLFGLRSSRHSLYLATGSFFNPGPYCGFLAMIAPTALYYAFGNSKMVFHWVGIVYLIAAVGIMPALMGRTGWIAAAAGCMTVAVGCDAITVVGLTICGKITERDSRSSAWQAKRYTCLYRLSDDMVAELDSLMAEYDTDPKFLFDYGKALRLSARFDKSNRVLLRGLEVSSDPMFLNLIGHNYQDLGDYEQAESYYQRSTRRLPGRLYPYYLLGVMYADSASCSPGKFEAVAAEAIAMEPKVMSPAIREMKSYLLHLHDSIGMLSPRER